MEVEKQVQNLRLEDVLPNRFQPRIKFSEESINELANSIKEHGVIQPIVVRRIGDKYEIIAGERRYKASHIAGKETIPAIISDLGDSDSAEIALLENVQRENLTPIEEAISYKKILDMGYTQEQLAKKIGNKQSTIANKVRLLNLTDEVQEALLENKISERHARSLLKISDSNLQVIMLDRIIQGRYTVRKTDEEIDKLLKGELDMSENNEVVTTIPTSKIYEEEIKPEIKVEEVKPVPVEPVYTEVAVAPVPVEVEEKVEEIIPTSIPTPVKDTPFDTKFLEKETFVNMPMHSIPVEQPLGENSEFKDGKYFELPKQEAEFKVDNTFSNVFGETNDDIVLTPDVKEDAPVMPTFDFTESSPLDNIETVSFGEEEISMPSFTSPLAGLPDIDDLENITANIPTLEEMNNALNNITGQVEMPVLNTENVVINDVEPTLEEVETITPLPEENVVNMPSLSIIDENTMNVEPIMFTDETDKEISEPTVVDAPIFMPVEEDIPVIPVINSLNSFKEEKPLVVETPVIEPVIEETREETAPVTEIEENNEEGTTEVNTFPVDEIKSTLSVVEEFKPMVDTVIIPEEPILKEYTIPTFDPEMGSSMEIVNEDIKPFVSPLEVKVEEEKEEIKEEKELEIKLPMDMDTLDSLKVEFMNTLKEKGFNANVETMDLEFNIKLIFTIEK